MSDLLPQLTRKYHNSILIGMKATTIKLDGGLLREIETAKPPTQSVTAYVREVVRKDLERKKLREAAEVYRAFVTADAEETEWLQAWGDADLTSPPAARARPGREKS